MANNGKHAVVVGAGVAGLATAYFLNEKGVSVTVIDKENGEDNCSYGNAGLIAPRHVKPLASPGVISQGLRWMFKAESPFYIKPRLDLDLISWLWKFKKAASQEHVDKAGPVLRDMLIRNQELLVDIEKTEGMSFGLQRNGHLSICETEKGLESEVESAEKAKSLGVKTKVLSAKEAQEMEPNMNLDIEGAVYYPMDAHLHPGQLMDQLKTVLQKKGVEFRFNTKVVDITDKSEEHIELVSSDGQKISGTHVVLCSGTRSPELMKRLHLTMPVQPGKGYSLTLKNPVNLPKINAVLAERKVAITPVNGDLRFAGTMEIAGHDKSVTSAKISALKKSVVPYFPQYSLEDLDNQEIWVGLRPCSPDGLPYVGKVGSHKNLYVSTGHSMVGMSLSFANGETISQLITEGKAELSDPLIDPNRYN